MNFHYFWKNVNKQLKSADFFSEMSKFQKKLLTKILYFSIMMSKHTLVFVVHPPNVKYLIFPISMFCYLSSYWNRKNADGFFNWFCMPVYQFELRQLEFEFHPTTKRQSWATLPDKKKSKIFCSDTDGNLIVAGHRYNLYMFTL